MRGVGPAGWTTKQRLEEGSTSTSKDVRRTFAIPGVHCTRIGRLVDSIRSASRSVGGREGGAEVPEVLAPEIPGHIVA